jgi:hypothetical protein
MSQVLLVQQFVDFYVPFVGSTEADKDVVARVGRIDEAILPERPRSLSSAFLGPVGTAPGAFSCVA